MNEDKPHAPKEEPAPFDSVHTEDGKWYFWDETWSDRYGPYETEDEARKALIKYCAEVLGI